MELHLVSGLGWGGGDELLISEITGGVLDYPVMCQNILIFITYTYLLNIMASSTQTQVLMFKTGG